MGWEGIGTAIGKLADFIPGRRESLLNKISSVEKEIYELQNKDGEWSGRDYVRYDKLVVQLRELRKKESRAS